MALVWNWPLLRLQAWVPETGPLMSHSKDDPSAAAVLPALASSFYRDANFATTAMAQIFFRGRAVEARPPMKERSSRPPSRGFQGPGSPSSSKGSAILAPPRLSSEGTASPTSLSESLEDSVELGGSYRGLRSLRARPPEARPASKRSARNGEAVPGLEGSILPVLASKGGRSFVETQPEPELAFGKCLSFAADSLDDVAAAIRADAGQVDWMEDCWRPVLHQTPIPECKPLLTRSLRSLESSAEGSAQNVEFRSRAVNSLLGASPPHRLLNCGLPRFLARGLQPLASPGRLDSGPRALERRCLPVSGGGNAVRVRR